MKLLEFNRLRCQKCASASFLITPNKKMKYFHYLIVHFCDIYSLSTLLFRGFFIIKYFLIVCAEERIVLTFNHIDSVFRILDENLLVISSGCL